MYTGGFAFELCTDIKNDLVDDDLRASVAGIIRRACEQQYAGYSNSHAKKYPNYVDDWNQTCTKILESEIRRDWQLRCGEFTDLVNCYAEDEYFNDWTYYVMNQLVHMYVVNVLDPEKKKHFMSTADDTKKWLLEKTTDVIACIEVSSPVCLHACVCFILCSHVA